MQEEKEIEVWVTVKMPVSLRDKGNQAAKELDTDLSKELRRSIRELIARANQERVG